MSLIQNKVSLNKNHMDCISLPSLIAIKIVLITELNSNHVKLMNSIRKHGVHSTIQHVTIVISWSEHVLH